jgi:chitodextrinase
MKHVFTLILTFSISLLLNAQRKCGTMEHLHQQHQHDHELEQRMQKIEHQTARFIEENHEVLRNANVIRIPVVVHVVWRTSAENISDAQVLSQITVLNQDFRRTNTDASQTLSQFQGVAADAEIEFCLATIDPNGNPTNGITRTQTTRTTFGTNNAVKFTSQGGRDAWPAGSYMNLWVCNIGGGILGYAQFPGGSASTDGIVVDYRYYGTIGTATAPFNKGRTGTHEVGHWLNLRHIWGDGGCSVDDFVSDTPISDSPNYGCSLSTTKCGSLDMVQNYMDYTDDACMNIFTLGQKNRMRALFATGGARASLLNSAGCGAQQPTCNDGIQNGNETGVDCGGSCPPCAPPSGCLTYCTSIGNSTADEFIQSVTLGSYTNNSGNNAGYASFNTTASFSAGQTYNFTLVPAWTGTVYPEYFRIWADWNRDGNFSGTGELIYDQGSASTANSVSGSFTVPSGATVGRTTFRVQMKYNAAPGNCETFSWGEVEDYCVDIVAPAPVCNIPGGLNATNITNSQASLNWQAVSGAISYTVRARQIGAIEWASGNVTGTSVNFTGLIACTDYEFQVSTNCSSGSSNFSASNTFLTDGCVSQTCDLPSGLFASGITNNQATLNWTAVDGAASYNVRARAFGATAWSSGNVSGTSINFTGLSSCTGYEFQVEAVCSNGISSGFTNSQSFISTGCTTCGAPTVAYVDNISSSSARFNWSSMGNATSYTLRFRRSGTSTWTSVSTSATSLTRTGLLCNTTYQYQLRARCNGRWTSYGVTRTFTTASCNKEEGENSLPIVDQLFDFTIFPNPASDIINLQLSYADEMAAYFIRIFDMSGRMVMSKRLNMVQESGNTLQLDAAELKDGLYLIQIINGENAISKRVIISK